MSCLHNTRDGEWHVDKSDARIMYEMVCGMWYVCMRVYIECAFVCMRVCACMCVRERDGEWRTDK